MNFWLKSLVALALIAIPRGISPPQGSTRDQSCAKVLQMALGDRAKINSGSTRREIEKYFNQEGGAQFRSSGRYIYPKSPYIHLDVEFQPADSKSPLPSPADKATNISKLYLGYSVKD